MSPRPKPPPCLRPCGHKWRLVREPAGKRDEARFHEYCVHCDELRLVVRTPDGKRHCEYPYRSGPT